MGKSLEHKMLQGLVFFMRGLGGLGGDSKRRQLAKKGKSRASGERCGMVLFF